MAILSKFHVVFSSSTLIRLNKDASEGHLCQTVNNFVKQNKYVIIINRINVRNRDNNFGGYSLLFCHMT